MRWPRHVARRFELTGVAICLPGDHGWHIHQGGSQEVSVDSTALNTALAKARGTLEFDARQRAYGGHVRVGDEDGGLLIVPLRHGTKAVGLLAAVAPALDLGALDAVAGVVAIAIERTQFLAERETAELVRQKADLAATLLASLSHDLKTPLDRDPRRGRQPAARPRVRASARNRPGRRSSNWNA